jgi:hypothetical protein
MKTTILLLLMFITTITTAQNNDERFTASIYVEPVALKDGFNIGAEIEYQMTYTYFKFGVFAFPELNNVGYMGYYGVPLGFNLHSKFRDHRLYTGLLLGFNYREGNPHPTAGAEGGYDFYFGDMFIGGFLSYIRRGDAEFYGGRKWQHNGGIKIGITF